MAQTFKVFDPTTGQYVEKEIEGMTPPAEPVQQAVPQQPAAPVIDVAQQVVQAAPQVVQAAQPVVQAVPRASRRSSRPCPRQRPR